MTIHESPENDYEASLEEAKNVKEADLTKRLLAYQGLQYHLTDALRYGLPHFEQPQLIADDE